MRKSPILEIVNKDIQVAQQDKACIIFPSDGFKQKKKFTSLQAVMQALKNQSSNGSQNIFYLDYIDLKGSTILSCSECYNRIKINHLNNGVKIEQCDNIHDHRFPRHFYSNKKSKIHQPLWAKQHIITELALINNIFKEISFPKGLQSMPYPNIINNQVLMIQVFCGGVRRSNNSFGRSCLFYEIFAEDVQIWQKFNICGLKAGEKIKYLSVINALVKCIFISAINITVYVSKDVHDQIQNVNKNIEQKPEIKMIICLAQTFYWKWNQNQVRQGNSIRFKKLSEQREEYILFKAQNHLEQIHFQRQKKLSDKIQATSKPKYLKQESIEENQMENFFDSNY